ncbi:hypothetical protein WAI453_006718 [Rhynchosporium graminicola]|uniref:2EXR domain-containing protein n=1 Tax=Rhynchosporium graminicola TaxID=2792576 RepID=A0A1E1K335_9HELO|nr:uncharacterized protein RCO7_01890 [Rhynchosporium commune]
MAAIAATTSFPQFGSLPTELRVMVWQLAAGKNVRRTIDVEIRCTNPRYVGPLAGKNRPRTGPDSERGGSRAHVRYDWSCVCVAGPGGFGLADNSWLPHVNQEARNEYLLLNPQCLFLENGRRIWFKTVRDTIYMDCISLYTLHMYTWMQDHLLPVPNIEANLQGFGGILNLESGLDRVNWAGLQIGNGFFAGDTILTGLRRPIMQRNPPAGSAVAQAAWTADNSKPGAVAHFRALTNGLVDSVRDYHPSQITVVWRHIEHGLVWHPPPGVRDDVNAFYT